MSQERTVLISATKGWGRLKISEILAYKDLLYFLTLRGIKAKYAQSILGVGWAIIQPLITTLVFTVVFGNFAQVSSDGVPYAVFSFIALVPWTYFSGTLNEASNSLVQNAAMISKVYFPRIILPIAAALGRLIDLIVSMLVLIGFLIYFGLTPSAQIFILPLLILMAAMASVGLGMLLSSLSIQYRDVKHAMTFLIQLLIYTAPVVYSTTAVPENWRTLYSLNPMVGVIEGFRAVFLNKPIPYDWITYGALASTFIFILGAFVFVRLERKFADVA